MWLNAPATRAPLREEMSQLMPEGPVDLVHSLLENPRVERNEPPPRVGAAGTGAQARIPFHPNLFG